jgi:integrase/recombinase XerC
MKYLKDFLVHLEHAREASPHTVAAYGSDLTAFASRLPPRKREEPAAIKATDIKGYLTDLLLEEYSRASVARHAAAIRSFFRYMVAEGMVEGNPALAVRTPRKARSLPQVLSTSQVERLLAAPVGTGFVPLRDRAILETLYSAGLRVSELVGLDAGDADLEEGVVRVLGKGRRERLGMLGAFAVEAIGDYLPVRRRRMRADTAALFLNRLGGRLTARSVRRVLGRYIIRADLPSGVSPHTLRHSFATHLLQNGAGLKDVQEMLGHLHLSSTQIYTHLSPVHLRRVYEASHPRAH